MVYPQTGGGPSRRSIGLSFQVEDAIGERGDGTSEFVIFVIPDIVNRKILPSPIGGVGKLWEAASAAVRAQSAKRVHLALSLEHLSHVVEERASNHFVSPHVEFAPELRLEGVCECEAGAWGTESDRDQRSVADSVFGPVSVA